MKKFRMILILGASVLGLVLLTVVLVPHEAQGAPPEQGGTADANVSQVSNQTTQQLMGYWTAERMAAARPVPVFGRSANIQGGAVPKLASATGPAMAAPGNLPGQTPGLATQLNIGGAISTPLTDYYSYPFPFDRTGVNPDVLYTTYPWLTNGKIFFTNAGYGPGTWVCSGTSVTSSGGNRRLVITAAHCLNSGGKAGGATGTWSNNIVFVPGRRSGANPNGSWGWSSAWIKNSWHVQSNMRKDYGFIVTADNGCGRLGDCVGTQGLAWNQSRIQQWWSFGYPQGIAGGERMQLCTASLARDDTWATGFGALPLGIGCDMGGGSSGGGWILQWRMATYGYVNSVNDYGYTTPSQPLGMYGAYFDTDLESLWNSARP